MSSALFLVVVLAAGTFLLSLQPASSVVGVTVCLAAAVILTGQALLADYFQRRTDHYVNLMTTQTERLAQGDFSFHPPVPSSRSLGDLALALNELTGKLQQELSELRAEREQLNSVLAAMPEGILAVDRESRIVNLNQAAEDLFRVHGATALGQPLVQTIRISEVLQHFAHVLRTEKPAGGEFTLRQQPERFLALHATPLYDTEDHCSGALLVVRDMSELRRLEMVRRDFVANVSHELKTPITSIKGFIETLLDGAMHNPEELRRFLEIAKRQSDRLSSIIDDLLTLARIEQNEERGEMERHATDLCEVVRSALQLCQEPADARGIKLSFFRITPLVCAINPHLIEQALVNLIDNAIKYSGPGGTVEVGLGEELEEIVLFVKDEGCGIERSHLPRLFERFYRVDKARSRKLGGTGLGLAIVKHIAQAHGGRVSVTSEVNVGSTFAIHLPKPRLSSA